MDGAGQIILTSSIQGNLVKKSGNSIDQDTGRGAARETCSPEF